MKYLIPIVLLVALWGYEKNSSESNGNSERVALPAKLVGDLPDSSSKPIKGKVSQPGLYRLVRSGGIINDPSTSTGKSVSKPVVELVKSTQRIPLIKGAQMYLQYRIWPLPGQPAYADLRRVLKHPKITLPNGKTSTGSDFYIKGRISVNQAIAGGQQWPRSSRDRPSCRSRSWTGVSRLGIVPTQVE